MRNTTLLAAFRYFIVPSDQLSFFDTVEEKRKEALKSFFNEIERQKKITYELAGRKHILVFNKKISDYIYVCKFGKEVSETICRESDTDIENTIEPNFPFVYTIIDVKKQIILIEIKTSVFASVITTKNKIQECFNISFALRGFDVILEEITEESDFWTYIESSEGVYEVSLKLNSPNLFGGKIDTNEMLKEVQQEYNNTHLIFTLCSEKAKLWLKKTNKGLNNALKYISAGAGRWSLTTISNGQKQKYESEHNIKKVSLRDIDPVGDDLENEISQEIISAINNIETIIMEDKSDNSQKD